MALNQTLTIPNFPNQFQSGITSPSASGRASDMLAPLANLPGPTNAGVNTYPGTTIAVSFATSFPQNSPIFETLPMVVPNPTSPVLP